MAHIQWKDRYNINFREIDAQHQGLLDLLNELSDNLDGRKHPDTVSHIFEALGDYAQTHFSSEERYMRAASYPKLSQHCQEHVYFVNRVKELSRSYDPADPRVVDETATFLRDWYMNHIIKVDQEYGPFLKRALPTASIEGILLGLEGVVCSLDAAPLIQAMVEGSGKSEAEVRTALFEDPGFLPQLESGQWDLERFEVEWTGWAGRAAAPESLASAYGTSYHPNPAMAQLAGRLKQHQPVALVGNAAPWMRSQVLGRLGLASSFTANALSCEAGARLPDRALLLAGASSLGLAPEACILIHRDPACIEAAQGVRMQTLEYTNPVMLMAELRRMGIGF